MTGRPLHTECIRSRASGLSAEEILTDPRNTLAQRRVLVISSQLHPGYNDLWDAVRPRVGALAVVGARPDGGKPLEPDRLGLRSVDLGRGQIWRHLFGLRDVLRQFHPDVVHVCGELWAVTSQEVVGRSTPVVVHGAENLWEHGLGVERAIRRRLVARAIRRLSGYASWNHDGALWVQEMRQRLGLTPLPTLVLPPVIPPAPFREATWEPPPMTTGQSLNVLLVGQLIPRKGFDDVIEACARLDRPVHITLCGKGPEEQTLRDQATRLGVRLTIKGWIDPAALAGTMASAHLLVQPSRTVSDWAEQFGRSVAEAMTVGIPCLVSDSGELPVLVGHDPSALFAEGDVVALTERMRALLEAPSRLTDLSRRQSELAERWGPDRAGTEVLDLWRRVLA